MTDTISTQSMVDRAGAAIIAKVPQGYGMTEAESRMYARAAITAMLDYNEAMLNAGTAVLAPYADKCLPGSTAIEVLRAMIQAALAEGERP